MLVWNAPILPSPDNPPIVAISVIKEAGIHILYSKLCIYLYPPPSPNITSSGNLCTLT